MPDSKIIIEWMNAIGAVSWPLAILIVALMFRKTISDWLSTAKKLSVGPFNFERELTEIAANSKQLLKDTSKLQLLIAESRAIETRVFLSYPLLSNEQQREMRENLDLLAGEIERLKAIK